MKPPAIKVQLVIFLGLLALYLAAAARDIVYLTAISIAAISAIASDSVIIYLKTKKLTISDSSVVTGLIIGYVLSGAEPLWLFSSVSILTIGSKHLIRIDERHIFNPAAFGIFLAVLFGASTQWKGANAWYVLAPFGFYFIYRIRKIGIAVSYLIISFILFGIQALVQKEPLFNALIFQNYFFIFVMLIEPKTTPITYFGKMIFGMTAAILVFIFAAAGIKYDAEIISLLILNLFTSALNKLT